MVVAHAAFTNAAKRQVCLPGVEQRVVHRNTTRHHPLEQHLNGFPVIAEGVDGQGPRATVDLRDHLLQAAVLEDRQDGAENFAGMKDAVGGRIDHEMRGDFSTRSIPGLARDQLHQLRTLRPGLLERIGEPGERACINDGAQVGRVQRWVALQNNLLGKGNKLGGFASRQKQVVNREANLSGIQAFDKHQSLRGFAQRKVVAQYGGRLAPKLQRHRAQVLRRCGHHGAAGGSGAGKQQVVKLELREGHPHAPGFVKKCQFVPGEISRYGLHQVLAQVARVFRHFHHRPVACRKNTHQRRKREVDRKVPRNNATHHPQGLGHHTVTSTQKIPEIDASPLWPHPGFEVFQGMVHLACHWQELNQQGFVAGAVAIVGADGRNNARLVLEQVFFQLQQVCLAFLKTRYRVGQIGGALKL